MHKTYLFLLTVNGILSPAELTEMRFAVPQSITGRLLYYCIASLIAFLILALAWGYVVAHEDSERALDEQIRQTARVLLHFRLDNVEPTLARLSGKEMPGSNATLYVQIFSPQGRLLYATPGTPVWPFSAEEELSNRTIEGHPYRALTQWDEDRDFQVRVIASHDIDERFIGRLAVHQIFPALALLPILAFVLVFLIRRELAPLRRLSARLRQFEVSSVKQLATQHLPQELQNPVQALNELLGKMDQQMDRERRFTADAAHELRTPLAIMQLQVDLALAMKEESERRDALLALQAAVQRGTHVVEQMLRLARLEQRAQVPMERVDLVSIARLAIAELAGPALQKHQQLALDSPEALYLLGHPVALGILVRNLVENSIKYSPVRTAITVRIGAGKKDLVLEVEDQGPGIPSELQQQVTNRFVRGEAEAETGSGLGLAMVVQAVTLHAGDLVLGAGANGKGLLVMIRLPVQTEDIPQPSASSAGTDST